MDYRQYLQSPEWQGKRRMVLDYYGNRCAVCNSAAHVDVHHRNYENVGHEHFNDLIAICNDCHSLFHNKVEPNQIFNRIETLLQGIPK